ncbi:MAG: hypothetical protein AAFQ80_21150 [Cyanobacteria bacterium J06621_8]
MTITNQIITPNFVKKNFFRTKYAVRTFLGDYPELFFPANSFTKGKSWAVNQDTNIVIEGFQRSGNTFSVGAFKSAQIRKVNVASHLHIPAQVIYASKNKIPTLVVIRYPVDSVLSWKALELESSIRLQHTALDYSYFQLFKYYIRFYNKIMPYKDTFVVANFEDIISDFGAVINKINQKFNTSFDIFEHNKDNVRKVFDSQNFHAGTSVSRQELKKLVKIKYQIKLKSDDFKSLVSEAENVYERFKSLA